MCIYLPGRVCLLENRLAFMGAFAKKVYKTKDMEYSSFLISSRASPNSLWHSWLVCVALASHQGDPGSIPGLWVGSLLCHEGFPDHPVFLPREKSNTFDLGCAPW